MQFPGSADLLAQLRGRMAPLPGLRPRRVRRVHLALPAVALGVVAGPTFLAPKNGGHGTHGTHGVPCRREAENANATACHSSSMFLMILMFLLKQTKAEDDPRHGSHRGWPWPPRSLPSPTRLRWVPWVPWARRSPSRTCWWTCWTKPLVVPWTSRRMALRLPFFSWA